ncbi:MAG: DNA topoisomerase VI subunit B [Candidatus Thorarchaeota archaeon]|jgi:DNA topoisomerase-6 subunit B
MTQAISDEAEFRSLSPAEFFYRNRHMAGFGNPVQATFTTVRELVENSLDSCEDASRLPFIRVRVECKDADVLSVTVSDNGSGVPLDEVPEAFGRVLYGSKYGTRQNRGTFGLGVTMVVLYGQITTDNPVTVHTRTNTSEAAEFKILIDVEENSPIVVSRTGHERKEVGTTVTIDLKGNLARAADRIIQYLKLTTVSTPHATVELNMEGRTYTIIGGWVKDPPRVPVIAKPHPRAADVEMLRRLVSQSATLKLRSFLIESFQQVGPRSADRFLQFAALSPGIPVGSFSRQDLARLSTTLWKFDGFGRPDASCLSPIGMNPFLASVSNTFKVTAIHYDRRGPCEWRGNPFVLEGVIATTDENSSSEGPQLFRFANRVPLLYDASDDVFTKVLRRVKWTRYGLTSSGSVMLFVNISSTQVPYNAAGKQAVTPLDPIESEALALFRSLGRSLAKSVGRVNHRTKNIRKMRQFVKSFRLVAKFGAELADLESHPSIDRMIQAHFKVDE